MRALLDGRLASCERHVAVARRLSAGGAEMAWSEVLAAALRREQGRPAEAEITLRAALGPAGLGQAGPPATPASVQAFLAVLVAEMGRDTVARAEIDRLLAIDPAGPDLVTTALCAEAASAVGLFAEADALYRVLAPHDGRFAVDERGVVCHGSVSRHLGRLSHVLGRPHEAVTHFDRARADHVRACLPLLVAHTNRQLAAVLRVWGDDDAWDRSLDLLRQAHAIYARIGVERLANEVQGILTRSEDEPLGQDGPTALSLRREGGTWAMSVGRRLVAIEDDPGLDDIARLLRAPHTALHVVDLMAGLDASDPGARTDRPWYWPQRPRIIDDGAITALLEHRGPTAYLRRLANLPADIARAEREGRELDAAVARAEQDVLTAELADLAQGAPRPNPAEQARRVVTTRIRLALDRIEDADPDMGRHLRRSVRTGTFCSYEPDRRPPP